MQVQSNEMDRMARASDSISLDGMLGLLSDGNRRAAESGRPILVSLTQPLAIEDDPVELFSRAGRVGSIRDYWAMPSEKSWIVSAGEAAEISAEGSQRFQQVNAILQNTMSSAILEEEGGPGPVFMGGFRFNPGLHANGLWGEFPDGLLTLPRWMVASQPNGQRWVTINVVVNGRTDVDSLRKEMAAQAVALFDSPSDFPKSLAASMKGDPAADGWRRGMGQALDAVKDGKLTKVTLARTLKLRSERPILPEVVIRSLAANYPECRVFAFCRHGACFVGASPEELVNLHGASVTSTCLAGSAPRGASESEDSQLSDWLLGSVKERGEHTVVVDWVSERMGRLCSRLQWDDAPHVVRLGNLQHLATRFVGTPKNGCHVLAFVDALHPTPAVGGMPLGPALEMIERLEEFDRGWYTGPVGWVDRYGSGEFAIAIRCALLRGNEAFLYAGAGIVSGSDPDREDQETMMKFKPLLTALGVS
jgi:isochorismate synthase